MDNGCGRRGGGRNVEGGNRVTSMLQIGYVNSTIIWNVRVGSNGEEVLDHIRINH